MTKQNNSNLRSSYYNTNSSTSSNDEQMIFNCKDWQRGNLTHFSQTCFSEYWESLPELPFEEADKKNASSHRYTIKVVDPYNVKHRMALGKYILEHTGSKDIWGEKWEHHWYWGYLAQLDWQWRSGRLFDSNTKENKLLSNEIISTDSWFGYMNMNFTVAFYQGAAKAGLVPEIILSSENFDATKDPGYQACVEVWYSFWTTSHVAFIQNYSISTNRNDQSSIMTLYKDLWDFHTLIIQTSLPHAKRMEQYMPEYERAFGLGWCHMVELLAAMSWTWLSLEALMKHGAGFLPTTVLFNDDIMHDLEQNAPAEHKAALQIMELNTTTPQQLSTMCAFFQRLTRWETERLRMPETMKILDSNNDDDHSISFMLKTRTLIRVLFKVALPKSMWEITMWNMMFAGMALGFQKIKK